MRVVGLPDPIAARREGFVALKAVRRSAPKS